MMKNYMTTRPERLSYAGFFVGQNIIFMLALSFLSLFYTDVIGLSTGAVATLFLIARIWDAVNDPILGGIVDKARLKKGKFKPWINAVSILMPIATILLFWNIKGGGTLNLTYAYLTYIIWGMIYTISDVPIFAIATVMTDKLNERVTLMSIGRLAAAVAGMITAIIGAPLIDNLGWTPAVVILMALSLLVMIPARFFLKERIVHKRDHEVTLKTMFQAVAKNKYLIVYYLSFLMATSLGTHMMSGPYFAKWNLGDLSLQSVIMGTFILPMIILPLLMPKLIARFGKKPLVIAGMLLGIVFSIIQFFAGYDNLVLFLILNTFKGLGLFLPMIMMGMFSADCAEYGAYITGKRSEGITFSIQTFTTKLSTAFSGALGIGLLGIFGYDGMADSQTPGTLEGIWFITVLLPALGILLSLIVFSLFYKLDEAKVEKMIKEMKARETPSA